MQEWYRWFSTSVTQTWKCITFKYTIERLNNICRVNLGSTSACHAKVPVGSCVSPTLRHLVWPKKTTVSFPGCWRLWSQVVNFVFQNFDVKFHWWQPEFLELCFCVPSLDECYLGCLVWSVWLCWFVSYKQLDLSLLICHMLKFAFDGTCGLVSEIHDVVVRNTLLPIITNSVQ